MIKELLKKSEWAVKIYVSIASTNTAYKFRKARKALSVNYELLLCKICLVLNSDVKATILEKFNETTAICIPEYFNRSECEKIELQTPDMYVTRISDAYVCGGIASIIKDDLYLNDILCGNSNRIGLITENILHYKNNKITLSRSKTPKEMDKAISLLGMGAENYYHFLIEIMSRILNVDKFQELDDYPILIDETILRIHQLKEVVDIFNKKNREIIYVNKNQDIHVKDLIFPSYNTWLPFNVKKRSDFKPEDCVVAPNAINNIKEICKQYIKPLNKNKRIFLSRKNGFSRLVNEKEVETLFIENGFEEVCCENLSFIEQIKVFSEAYYIVGTSGAALANLAFCNKGATMLCILPKKFDFYLYSTVADISGVRSVFIDAEVVKETMYMSRDTYKADLKECKEIIDRINNNSL